MINKNIANEGKKKVSYCWLEEFIQTDYLYNAEYLKTKKS